MKHFDEKSNPALLNRSLIGMEDFIAEVNTESFSKSTENMKLLYMAERFFSDRQDFIDRRKRVREYIRGNQWSDRILDPDTNEYKTEEDYMKDNNVVPLVQNVMRNIMRNLAGQYQSNPSKGQIISNKKTAAKKGEMLTNTLYYVHGINDGDYMKTRWFNEFQMSGMCAAKVLFQFRDDLDRRDIKYYFVDPRRFGFNTDVVDPRLSDIYFIYEIIDAPVELIIQHFAESEQQEEEIKAIYTHAKTLDQYDLHSLSPTKTDNIDFFVPDEDGKARLLNIWYQENVWGLLIFDPADPENGYSWSSEITAEDIELENAQRRLLAATNGIPEEQVAFVTYEKQNKLVWKYKFLTPNGYCLDEGVSPYEHGEHPYAVFAYPMIDGQIWGILEDIIGQQRNLNRYVTMLDMSNLSSAKGLWLMPEEIKPDDMTKEEMELESKKIGGVMWYKINQQQNPNGLKPENVFSKGAPAGLVEMMNIQLKFMQDISGVQPSIQGQRSPAGTPASLFAQEVANAATNVLDFMNAFSQFIKKLDVKIVKTLIQYYDEKRYLYVAGGDFDQEANEYDPDQVDGFDFDYVISQGQNHPAYRMAMDQLLYDLLQAQAINIEQFLENTSAPFADKLLESIRQQQQAIKDGQPIPAPPAELIQGVNQASNPKAMEMINRSFQ